MARMRTVTMTVALATVALAAGCGGGDGGGAGTVPAPPERERVTQRYDDLEAALGDATARISDECLTLLPVDATEGSQCIENATRDARDKSDLLLRSIGDAQEGLDDGPCKDALSAYQTDVEDVNAGVEQVADAAGEMNIDGISSGLDGVISGIQKLDADQSEFERACAEQ